MSSETHKQPVNAQPVRPFFALLGGLLAWLFSFIALWGLSEIDCNSGLLAFQVFGLPAVRVIGIALTLVASFTAVAAGQVALLNAGPDANPGNDRPFIVRAGAVLNGLFAIAIIAGGLPYLILSTCT